MGWEMVGVVDGINYRQRAQTHAQWRGNGVKSVHVDWLDQLYWCM